MLVRNRTNVHNLNYHLVWITKYRKMVFTTKDLRYAMKRIIQFIADSHHIVIQKMEILPDHIHILVSFPPAYAVSSVIKTFKGLSARIWFQHFPETKKKLWGGHLWSPTFYAGTVGDMSRKTIEKYINNQLINYKR
ncbi:IS200/IS605 family transposase [Acetilactobacillus jinshanensis]